MGEKISLEQTWEGSLILERNMGITVKGMDEKTLEYVFTVFEDQVCKIKSPKTKSKVYYFKPLEYKTYTVQVEVYENGLVTQQVTSPILDFVEDFVMIRETRIQYEEGEVLVAVDTELKLPKEYYAYYLKKNGVVIQKVFYTKQPSWCFAVKESGEYCVQVFVRLIKNSGIEDKVIMHTDKVIV